MDNRSTFKFSIHKLIFVISFLVILSCGLFFLVQKSIKEFRNEEITKHMGWMGNSVIYFCNVSYDNLARVGGLDDLTRVHLHQTETLETIEDFIRNNDFKVVVLEKNKSKPYLLLSSFPDGDEDFLGFATQPAYEVKQVIVNGLPFNTFVITFDSWDWQIILFKDSGSYSTLLSRLNIFYFLYGVLLSLLSLVIIVFFLQLAKAEKGIRQSELELKSILDSLYEGIISIDLNGLITQMNPASISICSLEKGDVPMGKHIGDILNISFGEDRNVLENSNYEGGGSEFLLKHNGENFNLTLADGSERTIQMGFARRLPSRQGGQELSLVVSFHDVTERIHMQTMMIQSEKMLSVGGLAAGMAHEINNPLAGMMQNAQVIQNRLVKVLPANIKAAQESNTTIESIKTYMEKRKVLVLLDSILSAGSNAAKIVENMLSFARKGDSVKGRYDIDQILEKTIDLAQSDYDLKKKYDFKQIEIIKEFASDIPAVTCEQSKIMQVFFNIIKNATQSMVEGEEKTENPRLVFRLRNDEDMVRIEIEDNGSGMDEDVQKRIFEPFFTTKDVDKGTGLGLSLSYFIIVDDHGGELEAESTLGTGTKFIIKLPAVS